MIDGRHIGHVGGVVQIHHRAVAQVDVVDDRGRGGDQVDVIFTLDPVADDLKVQQPQKAAAKAKAERGGGFHFGTEGGVVQRQFLDRVAQILKLGAVDGEEAAEHHRLRRLEPRQGRVGALFLMRDGVADAGVADLFDRRSQKADLAGAKFADIGHLGAEHAKPVDRVLPAGAHHLDPVALADHPVDDADDDDDTQIGIVIAVDQHRLERRVAVAFGRGQAIDDGLQHIGDAKPGLGRDQDGVAGIDADDILDLFGDPFGFGRGQVDLVQHRHDLMIGVDGLIDIGQRLRLDALAGIDHQQRAFDRLHRAADLIGEIDMAGGVDQVEDIGLAISRRVFDAHGVGLDGDAAFALDIHAVQQLFLHVAVGNRAGGLDQPVGKRGFTVVDMGHDGEIADVIKVSHGQGICGGIRGWSMGCALGELDRAILGIAATNRTHFEIAVLAWRDATGLDTQMLKIEAFPIAEIYVPAKHAKTLDPARVQALAEDILENGQKTPIRVRAGKGRYVLLEGLHRLEALRALGEETVDGFLTRARLH